MKKSMYFLRAATSLFAGAILANVLHAEDAIAARGVPTDASVRYAGFGARVGTWQASDKPMYWNFDNTNRADAQDAYWNIYRNACNTKLTIASDGTSNSDWRDSFVRALNYHQFLFEGADRVRYMAEDTTGGICGFGFNMAYAVGYAPLAGEIVTTDSLATWINPIITPADVMHAAKVMVQDDVLSHFPAMDYAGVTFRDRWILQPSCIAGGNTSGKGIDWLVEGYLHDGGVDNDIAGHRLNLLAAGFRFLNIGDAVDAAGSLKQTNVLFAHNRNTDNAGIDFSMADPFSSARFWPGSGYVPKAWLVDSSGDGFLRISLSFGHGFTAYQPVASAMQVTVAKDGVVVPVLAIRQGATQQDVVFDVAVGDLTGEPVFDVSVANVFFESAITGFPSSSLATAALSPRSLKYSFTAYDPTVVKSDSYSVKTGNVHNISTRSYVGQGDQALVTGVVVDGTEPLRVLFRVQGQSLAKYGVTGCATNPKMELFRINSDGSNTSLGSVDNWKDSANWRLVQALGMNPSEDLDCAMVATLPPGMYTAVVTTPVGGEGVGIIEAFNIDSTSKSTLSNLSSRGLIGSGDAVMIAGLTLATETTVVIRTQSPGLKRYGITNVVDDTTVEVVRLGDTNTTIATNDDWKTDAANARLASDLADYAPSSDREAALVLTLPAGRYTPLVRSKNGQSGVGIVEIFKVRSK